MNAVALTGRLVAAPETHAGETHESARFRLAVDRPGSDAADFFDVVVFDGLAKTCGEHLTKGRLVAVTGRLRLDSWTTPEGERRSRVEIVGGAVDFLGPKPAPPADASAGEPAGRPAVGAYRQPATV